MFISEYTFHRNKIHVIISTFYVLLVSFLHSLPAISVFPCFQCLYLHSVSILYSMSYLHSVSGLQCLVCIQRLVNIQWSVCVQCLVCIQWLICSQYLASFNPLHVCSLLPALSCMHCKSYLHSISSVTGTLRWKILTALQQTNMVCVRVLDGTREYSTVRVILMNGDNVLMNLHSTITVSACLETGWHSWLLYSWVQ